MKSIKLLLILSSVLLVYTSYGQKETITEANYRAAAKYSPNNLRSMVFSTSVSPNWMKSGNKFWYSYKTTEGQTYWIVDPVRKTKRVLFDNVKMAADMSRLTGDPFDAQHISIRNIEFVDNEAAIRFEYQSDLVEEEEKEDGDDQEEKKNSRKKMKPKVFYFHYNLSSRQLRLLEDYEKPDDDKNWAVVSPDKSYVLFSKDYNLFYMDWENYQKALEDDKDSTIVEHQLTEDGVKYFGYGGNSRQTNIEEEEDKGKRQSPGWIHFSRDSKTFAFTRSDTRHVKELWVINSVAQPRPTLLTYKYHMPGEKEAPITEMVIFDFENKEKKHHSLEVFKDQTIGIFSEVRLKKNYVDQYRPNYWRKGEGNKIYFQRTSRDLKRIDICSIDPETGEVEVLVEERLNTYVEIRTPYLINDGKEIIHWSERDGWAHFYLYDNKGNVKNQITSGPYHCNNILAVDEANRVLYFSANGKETGEDPYYTHAYKVNFDGSGLKLLTPGNYNHLVNSSDDGKFYVDNYSRVDTTPASALYDNKGVKIMDLETADLSKLLETGYKFPTPYKVKAADGVTDLYGVMYLPFDFDSTKKYPIIEYVYPGPQTEAVNKSFSARMDRLDRLAQLGFVVVTIGNRGGHPSRSKWYHNYGYGNLRDYGLADKKVAAEQLANRYDFIDIEKVGIFGHSGGGFMSTAAMLVYPDFFKVAVSSSGNHENNIYNRWWSEKHHGVKEIEDDEGNISFKYDIDKNSELAKNLKGKLMITTGDIDSNVHPGLTIRMANALIKANKRFDFFVFPGQRHGYGNMNEYFFWLRSDYFVEHLIGDVSKSVDMVEMNREKALK